LTRDLDQIDEEEDMSRSKADMFIEMHQPRPNMRKPPMSERRNRPQRSQTLGSKVLSATRKMKSQHKKNKKSQNSEKS